ncbi:NAD(P) transhydrogenase subunit alpha [Pirellulaceae bacterium]|nr:NAD(P) transhydrogenase subunit alpha [Pirellulaceae bacterium]
MNLGKRSKSIIMLGAYLFLFAGFLLAQDNTPPALENTVAEQSDAPADDAADADAAADAAAAADDADDDDADDDKYAMLMAGLTIFVISIFVGVEVITKVPQKLHTPLMSGSNAISGITIVGAILVSAECAAQDNGLAVVLVGIAIALAMINVVGGFGVTHRMLSMFTKRKKAPST